VNQSISCHDIILEGYLFLELSPDDGGGVVPMVSIFPYVSIPQDKVMTRPKVRRRTTTGSTNRPWCTSNATCNRRDRAS